MATKDQLYSIIAAYGLGRVLPSGSTRAAARTAVKGVLKAGKIVVPAAGRATAAIAPPIGRAALGVARRNPAIATGTALYALQQAGLLDPIIDPAQEFVEEEVVIPLQKSGKKTLSIGHNFFFRNFFFRQFLLLDPLNVHLYDEIKLC